MAEDNMAEPPSPASTRQYDPAMPIAVVGLSCRFPDSATSPEKFWDFLVKARCALRDIPKDRFNVDAFWHPSSKRQGTLNLRGGYFLEQDIAAFDAPFFSFTASEAVSTDPQQRLLLETAYEAVENAGIPMSKFAGSQTSCYVGSFMKDYQPLASIDSEDLPAYGSTGHSTAFLANRISHFFDLRGPSITLDTGCSGSTVSFHLACESIRTGEATIALAGGVGAILAPDPMFSMVQFNFLSPDSKCHSFDHRANGYARGEGFSILVLKSLEDAIRDNDTIRAVVRASTVSQDGKTPGITLPSSDAQADLIRATYRKAGLDMLSTGYFEAHGTGTTAGDAAELNAIGRTIGANRKPGESILVGSVKTNVGHLEGCAGLAGLLKSILAVEQGLIPQNLWFEKPSPQNDLEAYRVKIPTELTSWPTKGVRRASVNCFGFGGTLAHVILDDAASYLRDHGLVGKHNVTAVDCPSPSVVSSDGSSFEIISRASLQENRVSPRLYVWSSSEQNGVMRLMNATHAYLSEGSRHPDTTEEEFANNLSYTLCARRSVFAWRAFSVTTSTAELHSVLDSSLDSPKVVRSMDEPKIAFVFNGQGGQWSGMGRELLAYDIYRKSINDADAYLQSLGASWSALIELSRNKDESKLDLAEFSQPLCTVLQIALVQLLRSWHVKPVSVIGHSSGEIAAAYAANRISREDAWLLAYHRGLGSAVLARDPDVHGGMMAVGLPREEAERAIEDSGVSDVFIACNNSPKNVTISGDHAGIEKLKLHLDAASVFAKQLKVECPYHSPYMKRVVEPYKDAIQHIRPILDSEGDAARMFSTVFPGGRPLDYGPTYWISNLISPVEFTNAIENMMAYNSVTGRCRESSHKADILLEIGPHATLQTSIRQIFEGMGQSQPIYASTLVRGKDSAQTLLSAVGTLFTHGYPVRIEEVSRSATTNYKLLTDLPPYPWNHSNLYWHEARTSSAYRFRKSPRLDLVGSLTPESNNIDMKWRNHIRVKEVPWVLDHQVQGTVLYPAAGMICMVLEAAQQILEVEREAEGFELRDVKIGKAMIIPSTFQGLETSLRIRLLQDAGSNGTPSENTPNYSFHITARLGEQPWQEHCSGTFCVKYIKPDSKQSNWAKSEEIFTGACKNTTSLSPAGVYDKFEAAGLKYGRSFQTVSHLQASPAGVVTATIQVPDTKSTLPEKFEQPHLLHPTTLDGLFQTVVLTASDSMVPTSIDRIYVSADLPHGSGAIFKGYATSSPHGLRGMKGNMVFGDESFSAAKVILEGVGYTTINAPSGATNSAGFVDPKAKLCSEFVWREDVELSAASIATDLLAYTSIEDALFHYCSILAHKFPEGSVLEVGKRSEPIVETMLLRSMSKAETAPPFFQYNITNSNDDGKRTSECLKHWSGHLEFRELQLHKDPMEQGYVAGMYDLLIFNVHAQHAEEVDTILGTLRSLLKESAKLVILADNVRGWDTVKLNKLLTGRGFTELQQLHDGDSYVVIFEVAQPSSPQNLTETIEEVVLIQSMQTKSGVETPTDQIMAELKVQGYKPIVAKISDAPEICHGKKCISLLELDHPFISGMSEEDFEAFRRLTRAASGILWLTKGAQVECSRPGLAPVHGLFRSIRSEDSGQALYTLDLEDSDSPDVMTDVISVFRSIFVDKVNGEEYEFARRNGRIMIPRIKEMTFMNELLQAEVGGKPKMELENFEEYQSPLRLDISAAGQYDSVRFVEDHDMATTDMSDDEVEVSIKAISLRPVDYYTFNGQTTNTVLGQFAAGHVSRVNPSTKDATNLSTDLLRVGDRVVIFAQSCGMVRNKVRVLCDLAKTIPSEVSYETACSLAYDAIIARNVLASSVELGNILFVGISNETTLSLMRNIRGTCSGVWVVVKSEAQRLDLISKWRGVSKGHEVIPLTGENILVENQQDFAEEILRATNHGGVTLVVLGQDEEITDSVCDCLCQDESSRIVHVIDTPWLQKPKPVVLPETAMPLTYSRVDLNPTARRRARKDNFHFEDAVTKAFSTDILQSLEKVPTYDVSQIGSALQELSQSPRSVVLTVSPSTKVPVVPRSTSLTLRHDATYLIIGGFGGVGYSLAQYLIKHGAKYLAIISRSGSGNPGALKITQELKDIGAAEVKAYACDVCNYEDLKSTVLQIGQDLPPLAGLIHSAMSLSDTLFEKMTYDTYQTASGPKIAGSYNLHTLLPKDLDFFVLMSSVAGVAGTRGQANYNAGNAYQNALAKYRRTQGLRGSAIALTVTVGVGWLAGNDKAGIVEGLKSEGVGTITEEELQALIVPHLSTTSSTTTSDLPPAEVLLGISSGGLLAQSSIITPLWSHDNRFSWYRRLDLVPEPTNSTSSSSGVASLNIMLPGATSVQAAITLVLDALVAKLASSLLMPESDIDTSKPISSYGVDSLVAVEVRNWIFREAKAQVSVFELLADGPLKGLADKIVRKSALVAKELLKGEHTQEIGGQMDTRTP